jgi:hypothetical protein
MGTRKETRIKVDKRGMAVEHNIERVDKYWKINALKFVLRKKASKSQPLVKLSPG